MLQLKIECTQIMSFQFKFVASAATYPHVAMAPKGTVEQPARYVSKL